MGTYIRELTEALLATIEIKICLVTYHSSEVKEFSVKSLTQRYTEINIPSPEGSHMRNSSYENKYARAIANLLEGTIDRCEQIVFLMNYIDDLPLIKILKQRYIHPVVSVVHIFHGELMFNGNKQKINDLNIEKPSNNEEFTLNKEKEMYKSCDHVVAINPFMKKFLIDKYGLCGSKISLIRNGINFSRFSEVSGKEKKLLRHKLGFNSHEKIILFSGRIDLDKGIFFLLEGFIEACRNRDGLRLVFIGEGNTSGLLRKFQQYYGRITFTGFLSQQRIMEFYQVADVGVVPSLYEPCSYSRLEMIANRIPLILTKIEGFSDMSEENQCIFINPVISPGGEISFNPKEICDAILLLAGNVKLAETITANAYQSLINKYSASGMAQEMKSLFEYMLAGNRIKPEYGKKNRR